MEDLYKLKDMLCEELEKYGKKGDMSAGSLEIVDKLAHAIKNIDKIIENYEEEEYSGAYYGDSYEGGGQGGMSGRRGSYRGGSYRGSNRSYARGRGRGAKRDSMGRYSSEGYSRHGDIVDELRMLMDDAPDEQSRMEIQKLVEKMEMR